MLTLQNISKYYSKEGNVALGLRKINLTLSRGEFIAVVGESGSGKSTLLNVISGLDTYEDGEMLLNGEETSHFGKADWEAYRRDHVGFVFQDYHLIDSFTVYQNVETALILAGADRVERKKRALELIDRVGLAAYKHTKVSKLSGGQMQRTVIARALAKDSPIIAADEPTGHLDAATGKQIIELLAEVSKDKLVIVVTHNFEELQHVATRKITIHDGAVVEDQQLRRPAASALASTAVTAEGTAAIQLGQPAAEASASLAPGREQQKAERGLGVLSDEKRRNSQGMDSPEGRVPEQAAQSALNATGEASPPASRLRRTRATRASRLQDLLLMSTRHLAAVPFKTLLMFLVLLLLSFGSAFGYGTMRNINDGLSMTSSSMFFANSTPQRVIVNKADHTAFSPEERKALADSSQVAELIEADLALDQQLTVELPKRLSKKGMALTSGIAPWSSLNADSLIEGRAPQAEGEIALNTRALRKGIEAEDVLDRTFDFIYGASKYSLKVVGLADSKKVGEVAFVPASVLDAIAKEAMAQYKMMSFSIGGMERMSFVPQMEASVQAGKSTQGQDDEAGEQASADAAQEPGGSGTGGNAASSDAKAQPQEVAAEADASGAAKPMRQVTTASATAAVEATAPAGTTEPEPQGATASTAAQTAATAAASQPQLPSQTVDVNQSFAALYCSYNKQEGQPCANPFIGSTVKVEVLGMYDRKESAFTIRGVIRDQQAGQAPALYFGQADYRALMQDQNPYQLSLMTASEEDSRKLLESLRAQGYSAFYPHETLQPQTLFAPILKVIVIGIFLIGFIGVFVLISYFILRTIMKSKRRDYVILRSIGASQRLVHRLTFTEMYVVSTLSLIAAWVLSKVCGWLPERPVTRAVSRMFAYFDWVDYVCLYLILALIVMGLTSQMRKKLFSESVMSTYKGEEGSAA